jgi:hypothetical protein
MVFWDSNFLDIAGDFHSFISLCDGCEDSFGITKSFFLLTQRDRAIVNALKGGFHFFLN